MSVSVLQEDQAFNNEVPFCKVTTMEAKKKLERVFLGHRISYYIEWQDKSIWQKLFGGRAGRERIDCIFRINYEDVDRARELSHGIENIKYKDLGSERRSHEERFKAAGAMSREAVTSQELRMEHKEEE